VRIVFTGTEGGGRRLAEGLLGEGHDVLRCPLVRVELLEGAPLSVAGYDWLLLTSRHGVEALFHRLEGPLPRVAVIGPGTAAALREHGVEPALVARRSTQEGLAAELPRPPGRVLFAGAEGARDVLVRELGAEFVPLYRTVEDAPAVFPDADLVVLASPSAARALARLRRDLPCVSIGPVTTAEARRHALSVVAEAESHDGDGLLRAVKLAASRAASSPS
jgi:uroporphyrinogen III methyltransferase / synthase